MSADGASARGVRPSLLGVWSVALCALGAVLIATTAADYGVNWDEGGQARYGEAVLEYFRTGDKAWDRAVGDFAWIRYYGGLFEAGAALLYEDRLPSKYVIRHGLTALCGLGCLVAVLAFGRRALGGAGVAFFASLVLATLPRFYGHAFINSKDIPFTCGFAWAALGTWRLASRPDGWRTALLCGLGLGASLALRPGSLPLVALLFGAALTWAALAGRPLRALAAGAALAWAVAWVGMVAVWPWSHENPLLNPFRAVATALSFPRTITTLFEGTVFESDSLPRYYFAKYLAITTPPAVLLLTALGSAVALRDLWRERWQPRSLGLAIVLFWLYAPLALAAVSTPNVYDGLRHVLFVLPGLALAAGLGASALVAWAPAARRGLATAALAGVCALPAASLVRLHPYQATYFNAFVGGVEGAQDRYETDYWVTSYKEAVEWVNARAAEEPGRELRVLVAANAWSREAAWWYLGPGVQATPFYRWQPRAGIPKGYDYSIATTRYRLDESFGRSPIVHRVGRDGATFAVIRERVADPDERRPRGATSLR